MSIAFRKVWRDLWNHKGRTLLVVLSIAVGVLALGMTTSSSTFLNQQMALSRQANRSAHVRMTFAVPLDDDAVEAVARLPEVDDAEGWITANIRWKPQREGEWQDATLTALDLRHIANITLVATTPRYSGGGWLRRLGSTWTFSSIFQARSGAPLIGNAGGDLAYNGIAYTGGGALPIPQRPNQVLPDVTSPTRGQGCLPAPCVSWFNAAAVAVPTPGTYGNMGV